jgi:hypothetical protein
MIVEKNSKLMGLLIMKEISTKDAKDMIVKNHYSHKWNTAFGKVNIGIFKDEKCLGVASFGNLMNPKSYNQLNQDFKQDSVIELNRLWISDELGKNAETILLGASWKILINKYPHIKAVQSFADGRLGCGTIYKASNFDYYGYTESLFYENVETKETQHKVPMENTMRPNGMIKLNIQYAKGLLKPFLVKTYKYIYPLYKNTHILLEKKPYPEYNKGITEIPNYKHNKGLFMRAFILSFILDQKSDYLFLYDYIIKNVNISESECLYSKELKNKSILKIANDRKKTEYLNVLNNCSFYNLNDILKGV